jgi:CrcB protein
MQSLLIVGLGGFVGSVSRYALSGLVQRLAPSDLFPYGTLAVNVAGCLAIGLLHGMMETRMLLGPEARLFLFIGVLGGFTTFSTFGYESFALLRDAEAVRAGANVLLHVVLGLAAVWLGDGLARGTLR